MRPVKFWGIIALIVFSHLAYLLFPLLLPFLPDNITLANGNVYSLDFFMYDLMTQVNFAFCSVIMLLLSPKRMRFIFALLLVAQVTNAVKFILLGHVASFYFVNIFLLTGILLYAAYNYKIWRYIGIDGSKRYALTMHKARPLDYLLQPETEVLKQADLVRLTDTADESFALWAARLDELADEIETYIEEAAENDGNVPKKKARRVAHKLRTERNAGRFLQQYAFEDVTYARVNLKDAIQLNRQKYGVYFCGIATNMKPRKEYEIFVNRALFKGAMANIIMSATRNFEGKPEDFQATFNFNESSTSYHFLFTSIGNYAEIDGSTQSMENIAARLVAQMGGELEVLHKRDQRTVQFSLASPGQKDPQVCISFRDLIP